MVRRRPGRFRPQRRQIRRQAKKEAAAARRTSATSATAPSSAATASGSTRGSPRSSSPTPSASSSSATSISTSPGATAAPCRSNGLRRTRDGEPGGPGVFDRAVRRSSLWGLGVIVRVGPLAFSTGNPLTLTSYPATTWLSLAIRVAIGNVGSGRTRDHGGPPLLGHFPCIGNRAFKIRLRAPVSLTSIVER